VNLYNAQETSSANLSAFQSRGTRSPSPYYVTRHINQTNGCRNETMSVRSGIVGGKEDGMGATAHPPPSVQFWAVGKLSKNLLVV